MNYKRQKLKGDKIVFKTFNALLIPIMIVLTVVPFIIYLKKYSCGLGQYSWYTSNDEISDFYSYHRSIVLVFISFISGIVLLFRIILYKEKVKSLNIFCGLIVYFIFILFSTVFSVNKEFSLKGTYYNFENLFVLAGYIIICIYTYQVLTNKEDMKWIMRFFTLSVILSIVWGILQIIGIYPIEFEWFQKFFISNKYRDSIGKIMNIFRNTVALALYNPDFAGEYLSMLLPIFFSMIFVAQKRFLRVFYSLVCVVLLVLIWFTRYRGSFISLGLTSLILLPVFLKKINKSWVVFIGLLSLMAIFDVIFNIGYISKILDKKQNYTINAISVDYSGIHLEAMNENSIAICIENEQLRIRDKNEKDITKFYSIENNTISYDGFESVMVYFNSYGENKKIIITVDNVDWIFQYDEDMGYYYINDALKKDSIICSETFGNTKYGYLGSGRFYIWSRTIPMLKKYIIIGSGPNTFLTVFPQNDYIGKYHTYLRTAIIVDKAHNDYLMIWVQYGFLALVGYLLFYSIYFKKTYKFFLNDDLTNYHSILGVGFFGGTIVYMVNSFFIDSSIYVSPFFWIILGISMAEVCIESNDDTFYRIFQKHKMF